MHMHSSLVARHELLNRKKNRGDPLHAETNE